MELIETPIFTKKIIKILSDDDYGEMQWLLAINPEVGPVIPGGGGIRKLRWKASGKGKSGGSGLYIMCMREIKKYIFCIHIRSQSK